MSTELALVIVAIATAVVIAWQSFETRRAATAALLSARAAVNAERPWVVVQFEIIPGDNPAKSAFQFKVFNFGKSPAHILSCKGPKIEFYEAPDKELPTPPNYGDWVWEKRFLAPRDSFPFGQPVKPSDARVDAVTEGALRGEATRRGELVAYGLIEYSDGVSGKTYKTAYCYRLERNYLSQMRGVLKLCGPPVYNQYS